MLCGELIANFREDFPDLTLEIHPCQVGDALQEAVDQGALEKVKLVRWDHPEDSANRAASGKWVSRDVTARVELDVTGSRGSRLSPRLLRSYFRGDSHAFGQIVEFQGLTFEQAKVEVTLPSGRRTFNIERPTAGHPITLELEGLRTGRDGDPTDTSLRAALQEALATAAS